MSYYQKHIFLCENVKADDRKCCSQGNPSTMRSYLKTRLKALDLLGAGKIRVSSAGCMGRCKAGPALVIYPAGLWYHYQSEADIEKILEYSILRDDVFEPLLI